MAELCALKAVLDADRDADADPSAPVIVCTDSHAALRPLECDVAAQSSHPGTDI